MTKPVVVFSSHTLFIEGIVNRFRQHTGTGTFYFVNPEEDDYLERIANLLPCVIIIDADEMNKFQSCLLCDLLTTFPIITIIRLKAEEKEVQMIKSSKHVTENVKDLVNLIGEN